jgi:hypothetical protein
MVQATEYLASFPTGRRWHKWHCDDRYRHLLEDLKLSDNLTHDSRGLIAAQGARTAFRIFTCAVAVLMSQVPGDIEQENCQHRKCLRTCPVQGISLVLFTHWFRGI